MVDTLEYTLVDVFTDTPLQGNQLAVFHEGSSLDSSLMQRVAREMNLSETVFLLPASAGGDVRLRIFTPATELPFAGHPVLGTAFVVASHVGTLRLETGAGVVPVDVTSLEGSGFAWMSQPVPTWEAFEEPARLLDAVGVPASSLPVDAYRNGPRHVYVALPDEESVARLSPDLAALGQMQVGVSCFAGSGRRWKSRMFAPGLGVSEDPATGSAAGPLALHLARHGRIGFGDEIEIRQGAEIGRPSVLHARLDGSADQVTAVRVGGSAVLVGRGRLERW